MAKAEKIRSVLSGLGLLALLAAAFVFCQAAAAEVLAGSLYSFAVEPLTPGECVRAVITGPLSSSRQNTQSKPVPRATLPTAAPLPVLPW